MTDLDGTTGTCILRRPTVPTVALLGFSNTELVRGEPTGTRPLNGAPMPTCNEHNSHQVRRRMGNDRTATPNLVAHSWRLSDTNLPRQAQCVVRQRAFPLESSA